MIYKLEDYKLIIGPHFAMLLASVKEEDYPIYSKELGTLFYNLRNYLSPDENVMVVELFCSICSITNDECRVNCAFNFPVF